jgi:4-amino-4-deoxy-L-arabinose transferase-like glycosyltransferase
MTDSLNYRKYIWLVLLTTLALRILGMWLLPLTDTTEARYGEIARKMVETGNWVTPLHNYDVSRDVCAATACISLPSHDFGLPFWAKPPLSTWASAVSMTIFGVNEFAARLPSLLFSLGLLGLLYSWLRPRSEELALAAVTILSTSLLFFGSAGLVMTDLALIFCSALAMVSFWRAFTEEKSSYWGYVFFASLGLGLLAKGPLILVLVGLPTGLWVLLERELFNVWKRLPWITGVVLMAAIAMPWYWLAEQQTPGFLNYFIVGEHFSRFLISGWKGDLYGHAHSEPLGTVWLYLTLGFLPWFGLLILLVVKRAKQLVWRNPRDRWLSYLFLWTMMPVIFFTFAHNIIPPYGLPAMPAGAILLAELFTRFNCNNMRSKAFFITSTLTPIALLMFILGYAIKPNLLSKHSEKDLVNDYLHISEGAQSQLLYLKERKYSADFYSRGHAKTLKTTADINTLSSNNVVDYIAIDTRYLDSELTQLLAGHFKNIGNYREMQLYQECDSQQTCGQ